MKVLIVSNSYYPNVIGGAEKVAQTLAEELVSRGHQSIVTTLNVNRHVDVATKNGVRVYYLPVKNFYPPLPVQNRSVVAKGLWHILDTYNPCMGYSFAGILDLERPDVVNTHNIAGFSSSIWNTVKNRGIPLVHTTHDYYLLCPRSTMYRNGKNCAQRCSDCLIYSYPRRKLSHLVDVVTSVSRNIQREHLRFKYFERATTLPVYNFCEPTHPLPPRPGNEHTSFRFGFLGRLHETKGIELLVRSFLQLPKGQAELLIAGRGDVQYEADLKALTRDHSGVRWLGYVRQEDFFSEIDVLVVPSLWQDPAPLVVLESMARRTPVIGSRLGGIPEMIGEGAGWLFDPIEPDSLTRYLCRAIESRDELAAMGNRAADWASQFSIDAMVRGYLGAFTQAINRSSKKIADTRTVPYEI